MFSLERKIPSQWDNMLLQCFTTAATVADPDLWSMPYGETLQLMTSVCFCCALLVRVAPFCIAGTIWVQLYVKAV